MAAKEPIRNMTIVQGPTLRVKILAISPITACPCTGFGYNQTAASRRKRQAMRKDTRWPNRKSHKPIVNHFRQYSRACGDSLDVSSVRSSLVDVNGSKTEATLLSSSRSLILPVPTFFAFPHSEACRETSIPVGRRPRKATTINHEPAGVSKAKKWLMEASGAGLTR